MTLSPELLAAFADGELDADAARAVEAQIAASPELQAKLAAHHALRARLAARFAPVTQEPVPERLRQAVLTPPAPNVIDFASAGAARRRTPILRTRWIRVAGPALAASLVLALVGVGMRPSGDYADDGLAKALDRQLAANQPADAPVRMLLSFRDKAGRFCRGFSGKTASGIACRDDRGWRLRDPGQGGGGGSTEYRQAGNPDIALMAQAQDLADGPALDARGEAEAARRGWR